MRVLNKGTELDDPLELSLQERMSLSVKGYTNALIFIGLVTIGILVCAAYGIVIFQTWADLFPDDVMNAIYTIFALICLISGGTFVWLLRSGRKIYSENESINREYTQQNYLLTLSVSGRESEDAGLDFYNIARDIFPELKKLDVESVKKSGEEMEVEELTVAVKDYLNRKKGDYTFDIVTDTDNGQFIIKHFKKKGEIYKAELIESIPAGEDVSIYFHGKWHDLCRGPHLSSTGKIGKFFKLTKVSGAYW